MKFSNILSKPVRTDRIVVMAGTGQVYGVYHIEPTQFEGQLSTFVLEGAHVRICVAQPHANIEYVAAVYPHEALAKRPWLGFTAFLSVEDGHYAEHKVTQTSNVKEYSIGVAGPALLGQQLTVVPSGSPAQEDQGWTGNVNTTVLNNLPYFEFSWLALWQKRSAKPVAGITVLSSPDGFRAAVVGKPGELWDTIRIIRLAPIVAGTYEFKLRTSGIDRQDISFTLTVKD